jgi:asparagine synthase (glutamine-hydrolysing)
VARPRWNDQLTWLRPLGRAAFIDASAAVERSRPLSFASSVSMILRGRAQVLWTRNRKILARHADTVLSSPLLHPDFVRAVASDGGFFGRGGRTIVLRRLVPDLLPDEVLSRSGKARFNTCYMAGHTREFAEEWDGSGVDHDLVDAEALQRAWLAEWPSALTAPLLQQAWRASHTPSETTVKRIAPPDVARGHAS